eukprot:Lankesteria_metandrocarpae@DN4714_c0_g1_i1.p1
MAAATVLPTSADRSGLVSRSGKVNKMQWFKAPPSIYFGWAGTQEALKDLEECRVRRVMVLSDRTVSENGYTRVVIDRLEEMEIDYELNNDVKRATEETVDKIVSAMQVFKADCVVAIGGGSVMDVAKLSRIIYDPTNPHSKLSDLYAYDHMQLVTDEEAQTGVSRLPPVDAHIKKLVCIPTTSGTGSEMTPIAWVLEDEKSATSKLAIKRPIISWRMTPDIAINDGFYTAGLSKELIINGGFNALCGALESSVSRLANDYTYALSQRAAKLIFQNLKASALEGDREARVSCHNGASLAGMAAANAFVGIAHAMSFIFQRIAALNDPPVSMSQGVASASVICQVIKFNALKSPVITRRYSFVAEQMGVATSSDELSCMDKTDLIVSSLNAMKVDLGVPLSVKAMGISKEFFESKVNEAAVEVLKVVGCAATNPVDVTEDECKTLLCHAFEGTVPTKV